MKRRPAALLALFIVCLTGILYALGVFSARGMPDAAARKALSQLMEVPREYTVCGRVSSCAVYDDYAVVILKKASLSYQSRFYPIQNVKITYSGRERFSCGNALRAIGNLSSPESAQNPGEFDRAQYCRIRKIAYLMKNPAMSRIDTQVFPAAEWLSRMSQRMRNRIIRVYPADVSGILCAMILGDKNDTDDTLRARWRIGGIAHMLAISGMHLTVLGFGIYRIIFFLCRILLGRIRRIPSGGIPNPAVPAGAASLILMAFYVLLIGAPVSAVRAFLMFALGIGARMTGRTYDFPTALSLSAILILFDNPCYIGDSGFQMSFSAAFFCWYFRNHSRATTALLLSLYTLPIILTSYSEFPLYSIPVNLLAVPLLPVILGSGIAGMVQPFPGYPAAILLRALNTLLGFVTSLPHPAMIMGRPSVIRIALYYLFLTAWTAFYEKNRAKFRRFRILPLLIPIILILAGRVPDGKLHLTFLSVGQGDGIVCETPDGINFSIDGGSSSVYEVGPRKILPFLKYRGIRRLHYVFLTHMDEDHVNGIREILEQMADGTAGIRADALVLPRGSLRDESAREMAALAVRAGMRVLTAAKGDRFVFGAVRIDVLGPDPEAETADEDANSLCLVLALHYRDFDALFTGDVCGAGEKRLISALEETDLRYEVLKTAHHGSRYSTPADFLDTVRPLVSVISCGKDNRYGHPHDELLKRLADVGTRIERTDLCGAIQIVTDGLGFRVEEYIRAA